MSDVAESLIKKYLLDLGLIPPDDPVPISSYASFAELIKEHRQFLENHVKIPKPVIDAAVRGDRPSEVNLLKIGMALNLTQEDFDMLIEKSFPDIDDDPDKSSNGEVTNGASR